MAPLAPLIPLGPCEEHHIHSALIEVIYFVAAELKFSSHSFKIFLRFNKALTMKNQCRQRHISPPDSEFGMINSSTQLRNGSEGLLTGIPAGPAGPRGPVPPGIPYNKAFIRNRIFCNIIRLQCHF